MADLGGGDYMMHWGSSKSLQAIYDDIKILSEWAANNRNVGRSGGWEVEVLPWPVMSARGRFLYRRDADTVTLLRSSDFGTTWEPIFSIEEGYIANVYALPGGGVLVFNQFGDIWQSDNGSVFTKAVFAPEPKRPSRGPLGTQGIADFGGTIVFGEYNNDDATHTRLWRSTDKGKTWSVVHEWLGPGSGASHEVRHIHSVNHIRYPEPQFIATTGDGDQQVRWVRSLDDGQTWEEVVSRDNLGYQNTQIYRTLSVESNEIGYLMWGSDTFPPAAAIYRLKIEDLGDSSKQPEVVSRLPDACYGLRLRGDFGICVVMGEFTEVPQALLLVTSDAGRSWEPLFVVDSPDPNRNTWGYNRIHGPDGRGWYYLQATSLTHPNYRGIRVRLSGSKHI